MSVRPGSRLRQAILVVVGAWLLAAIPSQALAQAEGERIVVLPIDGVVDPFVADHVSHTIQTTDASAVLIEIDTPGGYDSSMREIVEAILNARVPVVCFVAPAGARAASAGAFILLSCPVAAMAPGTNVGASTPVGISGATLTRKVTNDAAAYIRSLAERRGRNADVAESFVRDAASISARQALDDGVIDLIASDRADLLTQLDGRTVDLGSGRSTVLHTAGATVEERDLGSFVGFLHALINPSLVFLFFWVGLILIVLELVTPGHIGSGIVGTMLFGAALLSFGFFPVRLIGVVLLAASVVFFLIELKHPGLGVWSLLAIASLSLGGWFLFDRAGGAGVSPLAIAPVAIIAALFFGFVVAKALAMRHLPPPDGVRAVVGKEGVVVGAGLTPAGVVRVAAEEWRASSSAGPVPAGTRIRVTALDGLVLTVEPLSVEHAPAGGELPGPEGGN
jgi:membrane-bound serine protease (ClpP class)